MAAEKSRPRRGAAERNSGLSHMVFLGTSRSQRYGGGARARNPAPGRCSEISQPGWRRAPKRTEFDRGMRQFGCA